MSEVKQLSEAYKQCARVQVEACPSVEVPVHAAVHLMNDGRDGAFVEAVIYVPPQGEEKDDA